MDIARQRQRFSNKINEVIEAIMARHHLPYYNILFYIISQSFLKTRFNRVTNNYDVINETDDERLNRIILGFDDYFHNVVLYNRQYRRSQIINLILKHIDNQITDDLINHIKHYDIPIINNLERRLF